ncbi:bifunctional UDP-N-acetylglucosamine diphosphorylase/glucosamine-1-phosphate N-acetyltransferase GlmU [Methylovorus mays]|uniref:bifunctional UDP-N-acetylglucosamine diphosphorylase/glucosamine-1-phosphate N-acetyltransferase GlmU n=1 Tax=Methylovorus mays TaxID=184077 RepID=UPI001E54AB57|nr:bifunctional UDP-N-acetylglucosamine diphosphorylase/glucosamine-1-phosphate N-acetyltransferase GlmU [Methylovorus mays]MCB5208296.1 bifunctional UDP-N-acetylglucosamine diphosphorylase/glucosamine-1-phosphate N-acetyltransferase GlmU [Methylovorus mays]
MLNILILAAGKGTRMHSDLPKVLHPVAGKPMLAHVIETAKQLSPSKILVVYGFGGDAVPIQFRHENIQWVQQAEQLGTGHAVMQALPFLDPEASTLIMLGDVPLISVQTCQELLKSQAKLTLLTFAKANPSGYGRIVRNAQDEVVAIVEHKDASEEQRQINEINTGIMAVDNHALSEWLKNLGNDNAQGEYYLTDIVGMASQHGIAVGGVLAPNESEITGINSKSDLAAIERCFQQQQAAQLLQQGVTLSDPARIDIRGKLTVGRDVSIDVGCVFEGDVTLADGVRIGPYCVIRNASIGVGTTIAAFTHIDDAEVGKQAKIGPYARLRPGTVLQDDTHVGNFVELKNAQVDVGSKINHLSYVGDTTVGKQVNIGAGTITCNYDGVNKFRTVIGDNAFIGSDSQLIAPVTIGAGATIGAGSTISKDAPAGELTVARGRQVTVTGWKRPEKIKK